jgi:thermitase
VHVMRTKNRFRLAKLGLWSLVLWLVALVLIADITIVQADDDDFPDDIVPGELIVRLEPGYNINTINTKYQTSVLDQISDLNLFRLKLKPGAIEQDEWSAIKGEPGVRYADFHFIHQAPEGRPWIATFNGSSDPAPYSQQYLNTLLKLPQVHKISKGAGVTVAVLDSGIDLDHPALKARISNFRYDFLDNDASPDDLPNSLDDDADGVIDEATGHGTHVAGLVLLVAPRSNIMPLRVLDSDGRGSLFAIIKAIKYAADNNARVINLSLGTYADTAAMRELLNYAWLRQSILVSAAGNENTDQQDKWQYPAAIEQSLGVAATDQNDRKATFSNYHQYLDISAPGVSLYSTFWNGGYSYWSGTSMATPLVSGGAALVLARSPKLTASQVIDRLKTSALPIDNLNPQYQGKIGSGRLDLLKALPISGKVNSLSSSTRLATTQNNQSAKLVANGSVPAVGNSSTVRLSAWGVGGIPDDAYGIIGTITNLNCTGGANFRFWTGGTAPNFNNLNVPGAQPNLNLSSGFITPLDDEGKVYLGLGSGGAVSCGYVVDVSGYLTGDSNIVLMNSPLRIATTQNNANPKLTSNGVSPSAGNSSSIQISAWGKGEIPSGAVGIVGTLTNIGCSGGSNFRFWTGSTVPNAANLNVPGAFSTLNLSTNFVAPLDSTGKVYLGLGSGATTSCGYAVDVTGYINSGTTDGMTLLSSTVRVATTQNNQNPRLTTLGANPAAGNSSTIELNMAGINSFPANAKSVVGVLTNIGCSGGSNFRFWTGSLVPNAANLNVPGVRPDLNLSTGFIVGLDTLGKVYLGLGSGATTTCGYAVDITGYLT